MLKVRDFFRLIRWKNLLFAAIVVWLMEKMVAVPLLATRAGLPEQLPWWVFYLLLLSVVFIAAGGYVINDYFDVKIDIINRPNNLIVTRTFSKQEAMLFHQVLTGIGVAAGVAVSIYLKSWSLGLIFILIPGLLWFYSSSYKRQFIIGNIIVALVAALVPMLVAMANSEYIRHYQSNLYYLYTARDIYIWIGTFAVFDFMTTLIREILKDLQDQTGDRELECHTLPIRIGDTWTKTILTLLIGVVACGAAWIVWRCLPFAHTWGSLSVRYLIFGLFVPLLCELYLLWSAKLPSDYKFAQGLMKFIMMLGVLFSIVIKHQL